MKISYKILWMLMIEKDITKPQLRKDFGIATETMSRLNRCEEVALSILRRICDYLDCDVGDICEYVKENTTDDKAGN